MTKLTNHPTSLLPLNTQYLHNTLSAPVRLFCSDWSIMMTTLWPPWVLPNDRLGSWSREIIGAPGPNSYHLVGNNPGWLPDCLPGTIPCKHLHLMGLKDSPLCRKCGAEDETSAHIFCRCEALATIRHAHLRSFILEPEDTKHQNLGAIWCFSKAAGLPWGMIGAQRAGWYKA
jgi:hypothetical protein